MGKRSPTYAVNFNNSKLLKLEEKKEIEKKIVSQLADIRTLKHA